MCLPKQQVVCTAAACISKQQSREERKASLCLDAALKSMRPQALAWVFDVACPSKLVSGGTTRSLDCRGVQALAQRTPCTAPTRRQCEKPLEDNGQARSSAASASPNSLPRLPEMRYKADLRELCATSPSSGCSYGARRLVWQSALHTRACPDGAGTAGGSPHHPCAGVWHPGCVAAA